VREIIHGVLTPRLGPPSPALRPIEELFAVVGRAAAATIPDYMRKLGGLDHSWIPDAFAVPVARAGSQVLNLRRLQRVFAALSPEGYAVREAGLFGSPGRPLRTVSVAQAREAVARRSVGAAA